MSSLSYVPERGTYRLRIPQKVHHVPGGNFQSKEFGGDTANPWVVRDEVLKNAWLGGYFTLIASKFSPEMLKELQFTELIPGQKYPLRDVLLFLLKNDFGQDIEEFDEETEKFFREQLRNRAWVIPALFTCLEEKLITVEFGAPEHRPNSVDHSETDASAAE